MSLPAQARIIVVGGGIAGCSTAYHLAKNGHADVLLLEQGQLTCGTTWHAAGLVGQMRPNRNMTEMSRYGIALYATLEAETGLATGWKQCGSVNVAQTEDRMKMLRRQLALARRFGIDCEEISAAEAGRRFPVLETSDLAGAIWIPGDGKANPADLTMSLAKGARQRGVRIVEGAEVIAVHTERARRGSEGRRRVAGVRVRVGEGAESEERAIACEVLVNCAGQWARQFGELAGVMVPLWSAEHFYIVTDRIEGVHPMLPVLRDPDGAIYYKEEVGGLLMGGFEAKAKPWAVDPIPSTFRFQLLDEDWDQFEPLMTAALKRTPCLETAQVKLLLNGPESFTPDGNFLLGEAPHVDGYFVAAGFNSAGIANSGGAGKLIAEWITAGEAPMDLSDVDIRRFGPMWANKKALAERTGETLGLHYAMRWPRQELESARPLRTSPLFDLLVARGAVFGSKNGWERANYFRRDRVVAIAHGRPLPPRYPDTLGMPAWLPDVIAEQRATREAVAIYDQTSFGKILVQGRDALAVLQRVCANEMDVLPGSIVYTPMLNARAGYESDVTVTRLGAERFLVVTGSAQTTRDLDWIDKHTRRDENATFSDVTGATAVLSLMGPNARELLGRAGARGTFEAIGRERMAHATTCEIDIGHARVRAARMSYVGGPGYELYVPVGEARTVYLALHEAGDGLGIDGGGLVDAGYYAMDALRIEAGRRAWGAELGPDVTPVEAGAMASVRIDKAGGFVGHEAIVRSDRASSRKKLAQVTFDSPELYAWGGDSVLLGRETVGELTSSGWSLKAGSIVALALVATEVDESARLLVDVWGELEPGRIRAKA
jgi:glycine cleavage system aminomethyltransferase T/glycine/D-amino acid oxidase-like deaminating enzyme